MSFSCLCVSFRRIDYSFSAQRAFVFDRRIFACHLVQAFSVEHVRLAALELDHEIFLFIQLKADGALFIVDPGQVLQFARGVFKVGKLLELLLILRQQVFHDPFVHDVLLADNVHIRLAEELRRLLECK